MAIGARQLVRKPGRVSFRDRELGQKPSEPTLHLARYPLSTGQRVEHGNPAGQALLARTRIPWNTSLRLQGQKIPNSWRIRSDYTVENRHLEAWWISLKYDIAIRPRASCGLPPLSGSARPS